MEDGSKLAGTFVDGTITFVGKGLSCSGPVTFTSAGTGTGAVSCANGQTGIFVWRASGQRGFGEGQIGGRRFTAEFKIS
ncbi:hypothetical protein DFR50_14610 [Roseiarcus fermentans]|uniref:Uncharacterized protein n=1 Tax=Roseiarcus fermentans TaxID=1473586 RepID=A0A366EM75_9HYPH|nr:hypothetical protein [Roseiarcus fermentans]RBP03086.1 hypothetical protein DFR50_14610 [Roseiarcus fermentans]